MVSRVDQPAWRCERNNIRTSRPALNASCGARKLPFVPRVVVRFALHASGIVGPRAVISYME